MAAWSVQIADADRLQHGAGKWWNALIVSNEDPATKASKPYKCALGSGYAFTASGANATRLGNHVAGDTADIKSCAKATPSDKALAQTKRSSSRAGKGPRRFSTPSPTNAEAAATVLHAAGIMPSPEGIETAADKAVLGAEVQETLRQGNLNGMFRHIMFSTVVRMDFRTVCSARARVFRGL